MLPNKINKSSRFSILKLTPGFVVAFIALRHIIHELHEFMHMIVGRLLCGVWGTRDFNNVHPLTDAFSAQDHGSSPLGLEGPFVNYFLIWLGALVIVSSKSSVKKSWGFTLIFASLPFARLFTAVMGGGDEFGVIRNFISNTMTARILLIVLITSVIFYPLYIAFKSLMNTRFKAGYFFGFLILPMLLEGMVVLLFFNYLLKNQVLNTRPIMGSPMLVYIILLIAGLVFMLTAKNIKTLFIRIDDKAADMPVVNAKAFASVSRIKI